MNFTVFERDGAVREIPDYALFFVLPWRYWMTSYDFDTLKVNWDYTKRREKEVVGICVTTVI